MLFPAPLQFAEYSVGSSFPKRLGVKIFASSHLPHNGESKASNSLPKPIKPSNFQDLNLQGRKRSTKDSQFLSPGFLWESEKNTSPKEIQRNAKPRNAKM